MRLTLTVALLCMAWIPVCAASPRPGSVVNMLGAAPRSTPSGCELIGVEGPDYPLPDRSARVARSDSYYWFGCPSERRPNSVVLWRVRDGRVGGELRINRTALSKVWLRLSTGRHALSFQLGRCSSKANPAHNVDALIPVVYQPQEKVPLNRVITSWIAN